ncbi:MAG: acyl-CoA dehydrogenase [Gammaproteobacteria bacterium]|nr:acyl-CoA dehydrogenase [Gammaproteobacteria bacterium]
MDFVDAPEDAEFRSALRSWLEEVIPALPAMPERLEDRPGVWKPWQKMLYDNGYAGLSWPKEYGGRGASIMQQAIYYEECDRANAPLRLDFISMGFAGPTIIEHGSDEQKQRFLDPILKGEELWCQLFSEPGAGSDLAALKTVAKRDGDGWRVTGQKVWTSAAQIADYAILLARTGGGPRHKGITYFLLPMNAEGIEVRPLPHMLGVAEFNEVFLDDVYIPDNMRVGPVDGGWGVAMSTLGYERVTIAVGRVNTLRCMDELMALVRSSVDDDGKPVGSDTYVRQQVAKLYSRMVLQRLTGKRILSGMAAGAPGAEASTAKLFATPLVEDIADYALSLYGLAGQEDPAHATIDEQAKWHRLANQARGSSIAGGTTFVQRNILSERVLGLPKG